MMQNIHAHRGFAQISSKILFYSILILSSQRSMASEVVEVAGEVTTTATVDGLATAFGIVSCTNASVKLYSVGKDIKSYTCPNEKEQVKNLKTSKKLALAMATSDFKHCLITNKLSAERGSSGIPVLCEEAALMLIRCGGESEVIHTTAFFNKKMKGK